MKDLHPHQGKGRKGESPLEWYRRPSVWMVAATQIAPVGGSPTWPLITCPPVLGSLSWFRPPTVWVGDGPGTESQLLTSIVQPIGKWAAALFQSHRWSWPCHMTPQYPGIWTTPSTPCASGPLGHRMTLTSETVSAVWALLSVCVC